MADEPITPGAPEAGSEPTVEVVLEEPTDVIIQIIAFIATVAVLFVAWSLRVQKRAKQKRQKPKKRETLPGPADKAHVENLGAAMRRTTSCQSCWQASPPRQCWWTPPR